MPLRGPTHECRQAGIAAALAAGTTIGNAALNAGHGIREAADFAATAASKAASDFGLVPADAAALGGRAAGKLVSDTADRVQAADAAAEAAGTFATRVAIDAGLTLDQVAEEATIAACAAAEEAGSTPQHVAEVSAKAAGIAAGEMAADAGNTAMKSAEIAAKAATKAAATSGLPPYQAVEATATAAARSASRAAINAGHPYLIVAEVTRQLNTQLVSALKDAVEGKDAVSLSELKDIFSRSNIDIHEDTLRQVFEEMGVDPNNPISFRSFMDAVEKAHGIFMEAGRAAATVAGRVMGQAAAESGDDPEQAGEVAASAASSAAKTSGLSPPQVAEVAVTAAGNAAASAAIASGATPEQVALQSGQELPKTSGLLSFTITGVSNAIARLTGGLPTHAAHPMSRPLHPLDAPGTRDEGEWWAASDRKVASHHAILIGTPVVLCWACDGR
ncbi:unnamed protein product [Symbiodinium natans]|uniref:EF-hand domain-containing protein n=1 Tax=Symbiodinium natans TaxID=878477 RepID=A0A812LKQ5_9DINO|nr:unnamed protein product [Symbiodinium natans]